MSGFNFGGTPVGGSSSGGFSFGTPGTNATASTAAPAAGTFAFGTAANPAAASTAGSAGFAFGQPAAAKTTGLSLGTPGASFGAAAAAGGAGAGTALSGGTGFGLGGLGAATTKLTSASGTASGGFGFGGTGGLAQGGTTAAAPNTGFSLGATTTNTTGFSLGGSAPAGTGLSLGGGTTGAPGALSQALGGTTSGGFTTLVGGASATTPATTGLTAGTASTTQQPTTTGFKLGGVGTAPVSGASITGKVVTQASTVLAAMATPAKTTAMGLVIAQPSTTAATATSAAGGLNLPIPASSTTAASAASKLPGGFGAPTAASMATTSATAGISLGGTTSTAAALTTSTKTTASSAAPPVMNYRQLEEGINKWTLELEEQEKVFLQQATQVNAWDNLLIENGEKITQLNTDVERVKLDQQRLEQELDFILCQQRELEELLAPLEQAVEALPPINYQQHADVEREITYKLAENIDAQLKGMVQDLKEIIEHLNTTSSGQNNTDPVCQIAKILNAHMDSLQWVDQNSALLQRKVDEVAKQAEHRRKEQERNFRLAYD